MKNLSGPRHHLSDWTLAIFTLFLILMTQISYAEEVKTISDARAAIRFQDLSIFNANVPADQFNEELSTKRIHLLKHHKLLGHVTMGLMTATVATAIYGAHEMKDRRQKKGHHSPSDVKDMHLHMGLAGVSLASYFTTAYMALRAPKVEEQQDENARQWHKGLAYIHVPAMILSPILGFLAIKDIHDGHNPNGIAKLHRPLMFLGYGAFLGSYLSMNLKF